MCRSIKHDFSNEKEQHEKKVVTDTSPADMNRFACCHTAPRVSPNYSD